MRPKSLFRLGLVLVSLARGLLVGPLAVALFIAVVTRPAPAERAAEVAARPVQN